MSEEMEKDGSKMKKPSVDAWFIMIVFLQTSLGGYMETSPTYGQMAECCRHSN